MDRLAGLIESLNPDYAVEFYCTIRVEAKRGKNKASVCSDTSRKAHTNTQFCIHFENIMRFSS